MKITLKNVLTVLNPKNIINEIKCIILELLVENKDDLKLKINSYLTSKTPKMKDLLVNFLLSKVQLPLVLKPFKFIIKNTINKNLDHLVEFIICKIDKI